MAETVSINDANTTTNQSFTETNAQKQITEFDIDLQSELLELANRVSSSSSSSTKSNEIKLEQSNLYESFKNVDEEQENEERKTKAVASTGLCTTNDLYSDLGDANDLVCDDDYDDSEYKLPEVDWVNLEAKLKQAQDEMNKQVSLRHFYFDFDFDFFGDKINLKIKIKHTQSITGSLIDHISSYRLIVFFYEYF